jgi:hypothetical protein
MAEPTKTRRSNQERRAKLAEKNYWDELLAIRDTQREQIRTGIQVVKEGDLPLETNRNGLMRWYMHPSIKDTALSTMIFYQQEIRPGSRSGRIKFQGGQVIMVLEGKGYTVVDGVKHHWEAGDVINLPLRPRGIIVQHFNTDPNWTGCTFVDRGAGFEQLEDAPEYKR